MLLAHKKISGLQNLASLCNRRLPNIEGDQVAQPVDSLQMTCQWGHCKHNCIISLHEVLKCLERIKFNSCDTEYIIQIIIIFYPLPNVFLRRMKHVRFSQVMNLAVGMWLCDMWLCLLDFNVPYLTFDRTDNLNQVYLSSSSLSTWTKKEAGRCQCPT